MVGMTVGVEEEFHILSTDSGRLAPGSQVLIDHAARHEPLPQDSRRTGNVQQNTLGRERVLGQERHPLVNPDVAGRRAANVAKLDHGLCSEKTARKRHRRV